MICLMYEWPTLVRTGMPPSSATTSGTAREQIRLCRIGGARVGPQHGSREQCRRGRTAETFALLVDHEDPVGVTVEREADDRSRP